MRVQRLQLAADEQGTSVSAAYHRPQRARAPAVLLLPGAGGGLDGAGLTALADVLASLGHPVVRANLPHNELGRRAPKAERSVAAYRRISAAAVAATGIRGAWVVGGRSYGGRVASLAVADGLRAAGLLFYSYPLHPPGKPEQLRVEHWSAIPVPALFLQGDRDPFCHLDLLWDELPRFPRPAAVHVIEGGDHSLRVTRASSPTGQPSSEAATVASLEEVLRGWLGSLTA